MADNKENNTDDFLDTVIGMADRMGLTGDDKGRYVHEHMTRSGYTMVPSYVKEDDSDQGGTDFFGRNKKQAGNSSGDKKRSGGWFPSQT